MAHRCAWLWPALILLAGAAYQWLVYSAVAGEQTASIRFALAYVPLAALAIWVAGRARHKLRWSLFLIAAGVAIYALGHQEHRGLAAAYAAPHAAIYAGLLALFGRTLSRGHEPLITRFARQVHGTLPPQLATYTRRLTIAWCVFFGAQIVVSALLFGFASLAHWSIFVNVLNFPLLALMFIGEYTYRIVRHRDFPHASFLEGVRAFTRHSDQRAAEKCTGART